MNRGSDQGVQRRDRRSAASMRPRFMNRGSHCLGMGLEEVMGASMRPRFMNRGSPVDLRGSE